MILYGKEVATVDKWSTVATSLPYNIIISTHTHMYNKHWCVCVCAGQTYIINIIINNLTKQSAKQYSGYVQYYRPLLINLNTEIHHYVYICECINTHNINFEC